MNIKDLIKKYGDKLYNTNGDFNMKTIREIAAICNVDCGDDLEKESDGWNGKETWYNGICLESLDGITIEPETDIPVLIEFFKTK